MKITIDETLEITSGLLIAHVTLGFQIRNLKTGKFVIVEEKHIEAFLECASFLLGVRSKK